MITVWNVAGGVTAVGILYVLLKKYLAEKRAKLRNQYPANTVILHQYPRGPYAPNLSPYPIKLETYLRMAKIPYQNVLDNETSTKGKSPWITYNGTDVADSQFAIEFLNKKLDKDVNSHLSPEQKAIARAFQKMLEENFYWVILVERWVRNPDNWDFMVNEAFYPKQNPTLMRFLIGAFSGRFGKQAHAQGMGRHTEEEVHSIGRGDLAALSDFIGTKRFLMGDEPCEQDCGIFGILCQPKWHMPNTPIEKMVNEEFPVLSAYCERMKERFWPDWDECTTAGGTRPATK